MRLKGIDMNFFEDQNQTNEASEPQNIQQETLIDLTEPIEGDSAFVITSQNSNRNTYILLGVCIAAIVATWLIGFQHKKPETEETAQTDTTQLDIALAKLIGAKNLENSDNLVKTFYEMPGTKQVKLEELNKNPFIHKVKPAPEVKDQDVINKKIEREKQLAEEINDLNLKSILKGSDGDICLINGILYKVGDFVTDSFKIVEIKIDSVVLEADDWQCELEL